MPAQSDREDRQTGKSSRELAIAATRPSFQGDFLTELRAIRTLLERNFKPPTIQYESRLIRVLESANSFPQVPGPGKLLLDHDDDRVSLVFLNLTAGTNILIRPDNEMFPATGGKWEGFPLIPSVYFSLTGGGGALAPSGRIFAVSENQSIPTDLSIWIMRVDRFPRSTR